MINLKLYRQREGFCGPTSVRIILNHYGIQKTERELADLIGATKRRGCRPDQIIEGVKKLGFDAYYKKDSNFTEISRLADSGIPPIVYWDYFGHGHYSVFCGFNNGRVCIADPRKSAMRLFSKSDFLDLWIDPDEESDDKREILVIMPRN